MSAAHAPGREARRFERLALVQAALESPRAARVALVVALLLVAPTLFSGWVFDDYLFIYETNQPVHNEWAGSAPLDLFRWVDPAHEPGLLDGQGLAWWSFGRTTVAFMRPLSSLTHELDHWLWPSSAFGMHLHNLFWFACMLLLAARTYREVCSSRLVAGLASAMFALDSAHGMAVGWISNRNALLGGGFGIATLLFHHRKRSRASRSAALLAPLCFALGLLSTEAAVGASGYLIAYALGLERGRLRARLWSLSPYAGLFAAWAALRRSAHYGVAGLGGYLDPIREPLAFLRLLPERAVSLLAAQVTRLPADLLDFVPIAERRFVLAAALACCALALFVAWPRLRADREARFWASGAALSLLPLTAAIPSDRLLTLVGIGVMPVLAQALGDVLVPDDGTPDRSLGPLPALRQNAVLGLGLVHLALDPLLLPLLALSPAALAQSVQALEQSMPIDRSLREKTVIVANVPGSWMLSYVPVMRAVNGKPRPGKLHWLAATEAEAQYERRGPNQLRVRCADGFFDEHWLDRNSLQPLHPGDRVRLSEMEVTVLEVTEDGRPKLADFVFARPLESSSYVWLTFRDGRLTPFELPGMNAHASYRVAP